ncbi:hypothetical protein EHG49_23655 [Salmonella enterica]|nr:hypothetical protein [Salmonella enterica]
MDVVTTVRYVKYDKRAGGSGTNFSRSSPERGGLEIGNYCTLACVIAEMTTEPQPAPLAARSTPQPPQSKFATASRLFYSGCCGLSIRKSSRK